MEKQDIRVERSRTSIKNAFILLMKEREYDEITVKDLAEIAMINRKTFYAHYETKQALFEAMMREMFEDIFYSFIYPKPGMGRNVDEEILTADIRRFLTTVDQYREELEVMITSQTSGMAFDVSEKVILDRVEDIHLITGAVPGEVPIELYLIRIRGFFMMVMDWWLEQKRYGLEEAASIIMKLMRENTCTMFRYQSPGAEMSMCGSGNRNNR